MEMLIVILVVVAAVVGVVAVAVGPLIAGRRNVLPADQPAEMRHDEPSSTSDDPGFTR